MVAKKHSRGSDEAASGLLLERPGPLSEVFGNGPALLVSVRNEIEAARAIAGGARIIDVKEPSSGPLGRASLGAMAAIVEAATAQESRPLLTAALGELEEEEDAARFAAPPGIAIFKLGLAGWGRVPGWDASLDAWRGALQARASDLVAAAYADWREAESPEVDAVLAYAVSRRLPFLLIDTFHKDGRRLLDHASLREIARWIETAHAARVGLALAGSLRADDFEPLAELGADVIAVRGAACGNGDRNASIDGSIVATLALRLAARKRHPA